MTDGKKIGMSLSRRNLPNAYQTPRLSVPSSHSAVVVISRHRNFIEMTPACNELHWYEAHGIGKKDLRIKRYLNQ